MDRRSFLGTMAALPVAASVPPGVVAQAAGFDAYQQRFADFMRIVTQMDPRQQRAFLPMLIEHWWGMSDERKRVMRDLSRYTWY